MIPHTYPSILDENRTKMIVYTLPSIDGLVAWKDYIPVKPPVDAEDLTVANTFEANGFILVSELSDLEGKQAWLDYIPVSIDYTATIPWSTDIGGYIPLNAFNPYNLFLNNELGAWYDPSDINTYMSGLGNELVTNGDFSDGLTGWNNSLSGTISVTDGEATIMSNGATWSGASTSATIEAGKWYQLSINVVSLTGPLRIYTDDAVGSASKIQNLGAASVVGTTKLIFLATSSATYLTFTNLNVVTSDTWVIDDVTVKEVTSIGNATMFQDAAGTTPVTAIEQPVGLMLDKSANLAIGGELVTNGDGTSTTGWVVGFGGGGTFGVNDGAFEITNNGTNFASRSYPFETVSGRTYKVTGTYLGGTGDGRIIVSDSATSYNTNRRDVTPGAGATPSQAGVFTAHILASATTTHIHLLCDNVLGEVSIYDNISVKEIAGNHAYTPSSASTSRPTLSARYNLLTYSEQFDNAAWEKSVLGTGVLPIVTANSYVAPNGTTTADEITLNVGAGTTSSDRSSVTQIVTLSSTPHNYSFYIKPTGTTTIDDICSETDFNTGVYFQLANGGAITSFSREALDNGWFLITQTHTVSISFGSARIQLLGTSSKKILTFAIWGADLRVANDGAGLPTYQRVGNGSAGSSDYDTVNFPPYLRFDGTDDYMLTNSIDFTGTDKMTVFAGVRKLSDPVIYASLVELSTNASTSNGAFIMFAPGPFGDYGFRNRGTSSSDAGTGGFAAPITNVLSGFGDISGDVSTLKINGTQVATASTDQGTGNYGNYPIYIGRRGGSSIPFNGRIGQLIIRGAASTASEITNTEQWINSKIKAY